MRRAREAGYTTPVIAISGAMASIDPDRITSAGFVAAIEKPMRLSALIETVGRYAPLDKQS